MEGINGIADAINAVLADVRQKFKDANANQGVWESLQAFAAAVDWKVVLPLETTGNANAFEE